MPAKDGVNLQFHALDNANLGGCQFFQRDIDLPGAFLPHVPQALAAFCAACTYVLIAHELHEKPITDPGPGAFEPQVFAGREGAGLVAQVDLKVDDPEALLILGPGA